MQRSSWFGVVLLLMSVAPAQNPRFCNSEALWLTAGSGFGDSIARTPDLTGDGVPDVLVGASGASQLHVVSGRDGSRIRFFSGTGNLGARVAFAGDLDANGKQDFLASAPAFPTYGWFVYSMGTSTSASYTASESASSLAAGDVSGDGIPDVVIGDLNSNQVRAYTLAA